MELDISKLDRLEKLNCCKHYWSNVPMEIYISNEENKLLTIRDNNIIIWQSNDNYCKFLYCYHNSKQITLLQLIILFSNNKHKRLYFSKVNSSVTVTGPTDSTPVPGTVSTTVTKDTNTNTNNSTEDTNTNEVHFGDKEAPFGAVGEETTGTVGASTVTGKWIQIDNDILYNEINKLSEILPRNESEMERWTLNSNIENFIPKMKPKYFAVDLDRTFLIHNSKKMIENIKSFEYLRNNNFIPFFCTGTALR
ncbi:uncharacterized protein TA15560 [Theileria annulata]|uniref:Uncharacterized protein n=1 Tax=Theileria annulata TaxID=5874 RepID=Q4UFK0_THEAN|nr:uncharacterized protein TA15560 [Theileria annulata]CAI74116.1 hypothetical protein TA15560 [Theileria annulata]|eukprot:XP_951848.1 hypothetical protein TA15560 [Theileria annulata]